MYRVHNYTIAPNKINGCVQKIKTLKSSCASIHRGWLNFIPQSFGAFNIGWAHINRYHMSSTM